MTTRPAQRANDALAPAGRAPLPARLFDAVPAERDGYVVTLTGDDGTPRDVECGTLADLLLTVREADPAAGIRLHVGGEEAEALCEFFNTLPALQ